MLLLLGVSSLEKSSQNVDFKKVVPRWEQGGSGLLSKFRDEAVGQGADQGQFGDPPLVGQKNGAVGVRDQKLCSRMEPRARARVAVEDHSAQRGEVEVEVECAGGFAVYLLVPL